MTWGQYKFAFTPLVDRFKWLEPRHMVNISHRWKSRQNRRPAVCFFQRHWLGELGKHLGHLEQNRAARRGSYRRGATRERAVAPFLVSKDWEPMSPMLRYGVYASRWPQGAEAL